MKRKILLTVSGILLAFFSSNAQLNITNPFTPHFTKESSALGPFSSPSEWRQDSTWDYHWNNISTEWRRDMRTIRAFNGSGMLLSLLAIRWDYNLSEWVSYEKYSNEFYADKTTPKYEFRMIWDQSDQAWVEVFHASYQNDGKITESESKSYDATTNNYTGGSRITYTYSPSSMQEIRQQLDPATIAWENYSRTTVTYDGQGNAVSTLQEMWDEGASAWMNVERYEISYNQQGQLLEMIMFLWDPGIFDWKNNAKMTYEYNTSGWLISNYMYSWDEVILEWKNALKVLYHYDENGQKTQAESYEWNELSQQWENSQKEAYTYHSTGILHETFRSTWVSPLGQFMEIYYQCLDENGNETESWHKDINYQTNEYYDGYRTLRTWSDGLLTELLNQNLEIPGMTWTPSERKTNTWDSDRNLTLELWENYDDAGQTWVNSSKYEHFYSSYIGVEEIQGLNGLCYFQNPLSPGDAVRCTGLSQNELYRFRLIAQNGQTVFVKTLWGSSSLVIPEDLSAGTYILLITGSGGTTASGKVTVLKK